MSVTIVHDLHIRPADLFPPAEMRELMKGIGKDACVRIRLRTEKGYDAAGVPFRRYSDRYAEQKGTGLLLKGRGTRLRKPIKGDTAWRGTRASWFGRPDLTLSGAMLNDMQPLEWDERSVTIGFVR